MASSKFTSCTLGDIVELRNGKAISPSLYTPYGKNPVFGSNGEIARTDEMLNSYPVIVIGRVGAFCGAVYRVEIPSWVTDNAIVARPKDGIDIRFLYYRLKSLDLNRTAIGSAQPLVTQEGLKLVRTIIPPFPEQIAIASILGALDDKIELNRKMNETLEAMARAIFKSWFVDFDPIPGLGPHKERQDSQIGKIPKGWGMAKLGDVTENIRNAADPEHIAPDTPYIGLEHMPKRNIALAEWGKAEDVVSNKFLFKKGCILFGKLRPYFHKVGVTAIDGCCSTDILVVSPKKTSWFGLSLLYLSSDDFISYADSTSSGTKMPRTNWSDMARYKIMFPGEQIVENFNTIVAPMVQTIQSNILQARTLAAIRDALLPKLLSGEIRVKDTERFVGRNR